MKTLRIKNLVLFVGRETWSWLGWSLSISGRNVIATVTVLTLELGFEYVKRRRNDYLPKRFWMWNWMRR